MKTSGKGIGAVSYDFANDGWSKIYGPGPTIRHPANSFATTTMEHQAKHRLG